MIINFNSSF